MRLIKICQYYEVYLRFREKADPLPAGAPYAEQLECLMRNCFDWGYYWREALRPFGYEVALVAANHQSLQQTWARENGVAGDAPTWRSDIVRAQIRQFAPDIVWLDDLHAFGGPFVRELRAEFPKVKLWAAWSGSPPPPRTDPAAYDLIISNLPEQVTEFREQGAATAYLPHSFSPQVLEHLPEPAPAKQPFTFIGSLLYGKSGHNSRLELLSFLADHSPLQIYSSLPGNLLNKPWKNWWYSQLTRTATGLGQPQLCRDRWKARHFAHLLKTRMHEPIFGLGMYARLRAAGVSLNQHIDISKDRASNMRLFEGTGVGTCLLTDWKSNLPDFFEPEKEVVTYRSPEECLEKYEWLAEHPAERAAIARAGQLRTLASHTYSHRAPELDRIFRSHLKS